MSEVLLSVIVPVYNAAATLEKCAASVLDQAPAAAELILVDDGSSDDSPALCDRLAAQDARVRVIHQKNGGASAARNAGLAAATGRYVQFVDADDWVNPGLYDAALPPLEEGADVCFFGVDTLLGEVNEALPAGRMDSLSDLVGNFAYYLVDTGLFAALYNKIFRRTALDSVRFDEALKVNEDLLFCLAALEHCGPAYFIPAAYYVCDNRAEGSLSRRLRTDLLDAEEYTRPAVAAFLARFGASEEETRQVLLKRQGGVAAAQCAMLLGRRGALPFGECRRLFARLLAPAHCRDAVSAWVAGCYTGPARLVYGACVRLRLAGALALVRSLRAGS